MVTEPRDFFMRGLLQRFVVFVGTWRVRLFARRTQHDAGSESRLEWGEGPAGSNQTSDTQGTWSPMNPGRFRPGIRGNGPGLGVG